MTWQEELSTLARELGDKLTPDAVVDRARDPKSALHGQFEWNDEEAGAEFRLLQARGLIRRVVVKFDRGAGNRPTTVRAFVNVDRGSREFRSIDVVRGDDAATEAIIGQLLRDLRSVQARLVEYADALAAPNDLRRTIETFLAKNDRRSSEVA